MADTITILGSGTCNLLPEKAAASVLIKNNGVRLVYDFGRGTATRLVEAGYRQDDIGHIFISHAHPDHVTDLLPYLHAASWSQIDKRTSGLTIYCPPGVKTVLDNLFAVFGEGELSRGFELNTREVADKIVIDGQSFSMVDLNHSHGLRFGDIAIAGDAQVSGALVGLLQGTELAVFDSGHITDNDICELAVATQVRQLVCSHQYRPLDARALNKAAQEKGFTGEIIVASDLQTFEV